MELNVCELSLEAQHNRRTANGRTHLLALPSCAGVWAGGRVHAQPGTTSCLKSAPLNTHTARGVKHARGVAGHATPWQPKASLPGGRSCACKQCVGIEAEHVEWACCG